MDGLGCGYLPVGSSPLARGLLIGEVTGDDGERIIPARAGFTYRVRLPRSSEIGSSPLARGLPQKAPATRPRSRIIPARAGFTRRLPSRAAASRGSSPLARGLLHDEDGVGGGGGIIPARAGFTCSRRRAGRMIRDHPRSRGVYLPHATTPRGNVGSSPLARGLPSWRAARLSWRGIIPARAGFTVFARTPGSGRTDHPRSRGVYHLRLVAAQVDEGSSPLARGLRGAWGGRPAIVGIIPARAGFTRSPARSTASQQDHPRSRGVYPRCSPSAEVSCGSSPLARGLLKGHIASPNTPRIIPARAGFTHDCA